MAETASVRLLTIDDDDRLRRSIKVYFEDSGMTVYEARDGIEGLALFAKHLPDVVLVDLNMPGMSGLEIVAKISVSHPNIPTVVVSGTGDLNDAVEAVHRGVWDFVSKPIISMAALEHTVGKCLERAKLIRENEAYRLHLEKLVAERTDEVERTRLQVIQRLGRAAEYRDNETGMHVIRMSHFSQMIALKAGLSEKHADLLLQAAPMHDVGKIGIPDSILLKPGRLDPVEWATMMTHPQIGAEIIGSDPSDVMQMAAMVALCHHEKWDGSGYPRQLHKDAIPLEARIVAIADVYDALTSKRPYKSPWTHEEAVALIRSHSGSHFDPRLVECFNQILPEVVDIKLKYHD